MRIGPVGLFALGLAVRLFPRPASSSASTETIFEDDPEFLEKHCGPYLKESFNNLKKRDAVFEKMLVSDLLGSRCWMQMQPYVCQYSDHNPLYSGGTGAPIERTPEQCEALRKARLDRLNRFRTLESRRLIRAQLEGGLQEMAARMETWSYWLQICFPQWYTKKNRNASTRRG
jgi:hypothetical protein